MVLVMLLCIGHPGRPYTTQITVHCVLEELGLLATDHLPAYLLCDCNKTNPDHYGPGLQTVNKYFWLGFIIYIFLP